MLGFRQSVSQSVGWRSLLEVWGGERIEREGGGGLGRCRIRAEEGGFFLFTFSTLYLFPRSVPAVS